MRVQFGRRDALEVLDEVVAGNDNERREGAMTNAPSPVRDLAWGPAQGRYLADRVLDLWEEWLVELPDRPITPGNLGQGVKAAVLREVPSEPMPVDDLVTYLRQIVIDHSTQLNHSRFMGYVGGSSTLPAAAASLLAAGLNQNLCTWLTSPAATEIELHLTAWVAEQFGLPSTAGGLMVSGGAVSTLVALKAARDRLVGWDVRAEGVSGGPRLRIYTSDQAHVVVERAADTLGIGTAGIRRIAIDDEQRMRAALLEQAIDEDIAAGFRPVAVVGTAGTTATGAIDPLHELADLCERRGLWFHVDACYGGAAVFSDALRLKVAGIERADSISFDAHKWMYAPYPASFLLVRDKRALTASCAIACPIIREDEQQEVGIDLGQVGVEFSRSFAALKLWVSLLAHGRSAYARRISHDVELTRYLAEQVTARPEFELLTAPSLSVCCFRYRPPLLEDDSDTDLNILNDLLTTEIQRDGRVFCSGVTLGGRVGLRACIANFKTEAPDIDALLDVTAELGAELNRRSRSKRSEARPAI